MNVQRVTDRLRLPSAPGLFTGTTWSSGQGTLAMPSFDYFSGMPDPPPDPDCLYCPEGLDLYTYQHDGVRFLLERPVALLGDEMGLGKSIQAIAALRLLIHQEEVRHALILCPKTLLFDWYYKMREWAPDITAIPVEGPRRRRVWHWQCKAQVFLAGYETFRDDIRTGLADPTLFDLTILDEVQRIKNPNTAIYRAVAAVKSSRRWGLSGTPLENRVEELLTIFSYLEPDLLPLGRATNPGAIRSAIAPYVLRRCKADVLRYLPPKKTRTVWLELTPAQREAYQRLEQVGVQELKEAGKSAAPMLALALLTKLKLLCNLEPESGASCKMDYLEQELAPLVSQGEKALIFSQYPDKSLKPLLPRLDPFGAVLFDGSLSDWNRQLLVQQFQQAHLPQVMAMSLKCGGIGITLTRANHVYHFDSWWNAAAAQQAEDRTHRIGQKKPVHVTTLLTRGTVEERIAELVESKRELFHQMMDPLTDTGTSSETSPGNLTGDDLMHLFGVH